MNWLPSEVEKLSQGELQFIQASIIYDVEQQKKAIELAKGRGENDRPKLITARS